MKRTGGRGLTKIRLSVFFTMLLVLVIVLVTVWGCLQQKADVDAKVEHIHQLISLGMDIDEAAKTLRAEGFLVRDKHNPTGDYYLVDVEVRDTTFLEDFFYVTGRGYDSGLKMYVTITANLDGVITSIE